MGGKVLVPLKKETELLFSVAVQLISIHERYIPGKINIIAENPSRAEQVLPMEWSFYLEQIFQWGHPNLDLFATRYNTKCLTFVVPIPYNRALKMDTLAMD